MKTRFYIRALAALLVLPGLAATSQARAQVTDQASEGPADEAADQARRHGTGDVERGRQLGFTCLGCHGIAGYRNAYPSYRVPRLGGQKAAYIENALKAYRSGARPHPTMQAQAASLSDDDIADLVAWLTAGDTASDDLDAGTAGLPEAAKTCVNCHGSAGSEASPAPPVLSGQHQSYLRHALEQYKEAARGQNVMNAFATGLTPADMERIAQYYALRDGLATLEQH